MHIKIHYNDADVCIPVLSLGLWYKNLDALEIAKYYGTITTLPKFVSAAYSSQTRITPVKAVSSDTPRKKSILQPIEVVTLHAYVMMYEM